MTTEIREITDALESKGVFSVARLLDPEGIVHVAMVLATAPGPSEYRMWLDVYAAHYGVGTTELAMDALVVLSHCGEFVGHGISNAAQSHVRQLTTA